VLVPTMGALHRGHARLIEQGVALASERGLGMGCVATIFVNPTQFNERSDYSRYPRTLDADLRVATDAGASVVFVPDEREVYPPGSVVPVGDLPSVATDPGLEDRARPGHFAGVCQVVRRLFAMVRPMAAIFGEKDWQQLRVIGAMVEGEGLGIEVVPARTERDGDGMAMSSRNRFLSPAEREKALGLVASLRAACACGTVGEAEARMRRVLDESGIQPEYAVVRDALSLLPLDDCEVRPDWREGPGRRVLIAARVGSVRLIDNCDWASGPDNP
jgi:pantoate--beta-alanine ligase